ncbi:tRNA-splicing endonuclease subunit Sen34 isoform X2 [Hyposmocoma kahamanoa]|uniref:tRNA-splicing endonuclease subunit Sen34 isoform X2 n=1 Tax=Hyposmocoma kahamanoa TaxID=1477025 RepID=UPI000E6D6771|nr:tRNA-splicing endonuclease subunit Sen34 isoform X2 [Hyposmocoma kahamanoa]
MIPLYIENGVPLVWNSQGHDLRSKHRICGALIGSLPSFPRQNDFTGLPMALMTEEAALLVEKGICELYQLPKINEKPPEKEKQEILAQEQKVLEEQSEALRKRKVEQLSQKIDIIMAGKKQKLLSKGVTDVNLDKQALLQEEINKLPCLTPGNVLVHLPTEHYIPTERKKLDVNALRSGLTERDNDIRYSIFKDLWERGYYITSGSKFGSDYLLYPGDPVRFHAMYMVRCVCDRTTLFRPASLVSFGRLSVAVNKLAVLAFCNSYGKIEYQTLQWHDS